MYYLSCTKYRDIQDYGEYLFNHVLDDVSKKDARNSPRHK